MRVVEDLSIRNIYISLNYYCDNQCLMCGVPSNKYNKYNKDLQFYIEQINKIPFDIKNNDIITLSGGEPFMFSGIWKLVECIKMTYKCRITVFTNGRALKHNNKVQKLVEYGVDKLVIPFFI